MSTNARRHSSAADRIKVPAQSKMTREESDRLPLLDRVLLQEHERHAYRLAEIRRVADKLADLDPIVRAAKADGAEIDINALGMGCGRYGAPNDYTSGVRPVVLKTHDGFISFRDPVVQNAIANALRRAGWRVVYVYAEGSTLSRDRVVFMRGRRAVETTCLREWVCEAIEAGHIAATTDGKHPARDTGTPLNAGLAGGAHAARAS